ncbi:hypothetical protein DCW30_18505 [Streptomyces alfalfae]|nr:hypothetical protein DCW30_18505 [Streptomyces alfalfae]
MPPAAPARPRTPPAAPRARAGTVPVRAPSTCRAPWRRAPWARAARGATTPPAATCPTSPAAPRDRPAAPSRATAR